MMYLQSLCNSILESLYRVCTLLKTGAQQPSNNFKSIESMYMGLKRCFSADTAYFWPSAKAKKAHRRHYGKKGSTSCAILLFFWVGYFSTWQKHF